MQKSIDRTFLALNSLLFIWFLELVFPPITVVGNSFLICTICMIAWLFVSFVLNINFYFNMNISRGSVLFFLLFSLIVPYISGATTFGNRYLSLALIPLGPIIFDYYKYHDKLKDLRNIVLSMIPFIVVTFFITFVKLMENSYISRSIKSSGEHSETLASQGIGGYHFIYMIVPIGVILLYVCFKTSSKWIKWSSLIAYILSVRLIVISNYVTALLVIIIASAVLVYANFLRPGTSNAFLLLVSVAIGVVGFFYLDTIVLAAKDFIPSRLAEAIVPQEEGSVIKSISDEFLMDRWPAMLQSIRSFLENPIAGIIASKDVLADRSFNGNFGQHSHILDTFAIMGGLLGLLNLHVIFAPFKDIKGNRINGDKPLNAAMYVCLIGIYFFNNATSSIAWAFTIVYPLVREHYNTENEK